MRWILLRTAKAREAQGPERSSSRAATSDQIVRKTGFHTDAIQWLTRTRLATAGSRKITKILDRASFCKSVRSHRDREARDTR